jgi:hypothetical protein
MAAEREKTSKLNAGELGLLVRTGDMETPLGIGRKKESRA